MKSFDKQPFLKQEVLIKEVQALDVLIPDVDFIEWRSVFDVDGGIFAKDCQSGHCSISLNVV